MPHSPRTPHWSVLLFTLSCAATAQAQHLQDDMQVPDSGNAPTTLSAVEVVGETAARMAWHAGPSTGAKTDLPVRELPQSVRIITRQTIEDLSANKLDLVLDYVSGISRNNNFGDLQDGVMIRGLPSGSGNFGTRGAGNAVLIKSAWPFVDTRPVDACLADGLPFSGLASLARMQRLNPDANGQPRPLERLCAGQTLLCRSLDLKVPRYDGTWLNAQQLCVQEVGERPDCTIQTTRLGIPIGRDEHLPYRFVDADYAAFCTRNPLRRGQVQGRDYRLLFD